MIEHRLRAAGIQLTPGGEPTLMPTEPEGAESGVAADGATKLGYAYALAWEVRGATGRAAPHALPRQAPGG